MQDPSVNTDVDMENDLGFLSTLSIAFLFVICSLTPNYEYYFSAFSSFFLLFFFLLFPSNLKFHIEIQIEITFTSKLKFSKIYCVILTRRLILFTLTVFHTVYLTNVFYTGGRANMPPY